MQKIYRIAAVILINIFFVLNASWAGPGQLCISEGRNTLSSSVQISLGSFLDAFQQLYISRKKNGEHKSGFSIKAIKQSQLFSEYPGLAKYKEWRLEFFTPDGQMVGVLRFDRDDEHRRVSPFHIEVNVKFRNNGWGRIVHSAFFDYMRKSDEFRMYSLGSIYNIANPFEAKTLLGFGFVPVSKENRVVLAKPVDGIVAMHMENAEAREKFIKQMLVDSHEHYFNNLKMVASPEEITETDKEVFIFTNYVLADKRKFEAAIKKYALNEKTKQLKIILKAENKFSKNVFEIRKVSKKERAIGPELRFADINANGYIDADYFPEQDFEMISFNLITSSI